MDSLAMILVWLFSTEAAVAIPNGYGDVYAPNPAFLPAPWYYPGMERYSQFGAPGPYSIYNGGGYDDPYLYNAPFQGPYSGRPFSPYGGAPGVGRSVDTTAAKDSSAPGSSQVLGRAALAKPTHPSLPASQPPPNTPQESLLSLEDTDPSLVAL